MPPAARMTDMHTCPMVTGVVPHVGGPILPPCAVQVLIGNLPAARMTDQATCVGPPDIIMKGSPTVLIGNLMAARIGDITAHGGVIVLGLPTVMIGEAGMGGIVSPAVMALAISLIDMTGSADATDVALVAAELAKFPSATLQRLKNQHTRIKVCRGSITDYRRDLRGVAPRGWPPGSTWDNVPGVYTGDRNEVVIATTGHGTPAGAHVPATGEGHGSQNLVLHETSHAVDLGGGGAHESSGADFNNARNSDAATLSPYESQAGNAGQEETYAESAARYYGGGPEDATNHPNLHQYWESDPVK